MGLIAILAIGLIAGIIGTGSSIMLVPVLAYVYGPKEAVPIMAVAAVLGNLSRILAWWREVDGRVFAAYAVAGVPAGVLGVRTMLALPPRAVDAAIGMLSTGPASAPVVIGYGLTKGAFNGTEAASSLAVYMTKTLTFQGSGALPIQDVLRGLIAYGRLLRRQAVPASPCTGDVRAHHGCAAAGIRYVSLVGCGQLDQTSCADAAPRTAVSDRSSSIHSSAELSNRFEDQPPFRVQG